MHRTGVEWFDIREFAEPSASRQFETAAIVR
jgi:hypothetical protein